MFDTSKVWVSVLKNLRENNEISLHGACSDIKDIEFTRDLIILTVYDNAIYNILQKNIKTLNTYSGGNIIKVYLGVKDTKKEQVTEKLRELFGDRLIIGV